MQKALREFVDRRSMPAAFYEPVDMSRTDAILLLATYLNAVDDWFRCPNTHCVMQVLATFSSYRKMTFIKHGVNGELRELMERAFDGECVTIDHVTSLIARHSVKNAIHLLPQLPSPQVGLGRSMIEEKEKEKEAVCVACGNVMEDYTNNQVCACNVNCCDECALSNPNDDDDHERYCKDCVEEAVSDFSDDNSEFSD